MPATLRAAAIQRDSIEVELARIFGDLEGVRLVLKGWYSLMEHDECNLRDEDQAALLVLWKEIDTRFATATDRLRALLPKESIEARDPETAAWDGVTGWHDPA